MNRTRFGVKADAQVIRNVHSVQNALLKSVFKVECFDKDGHLKWVEENHNLVTDEGLDILLDIMFPEKKTRGFEAASLIKEKHPQLPILVITAINREYAFDFSTEDIKVEEFINKPVKINRLVEIIRKYI